MDPESMNRRIDAMTGWVLSDIDVTPQQRERIAAVLKSAANDLRPLRETHVKARQESLQLLAAPVIDRARLETLRLDQMQLGETASRRMLQAMLDAAEVLDPAQRATLVDRWRQRMERRRG
jgi:Spy/CpxP family protein refolding chaperone